MLGDYALCSLEELEERRKTVACLQNDLNFQSPVGVGYLEKKREICRLRIEILESQWAIDAKGAGVLPYVRYRTGRLFRHAITYLYGIYLAAVSFICHIKLWFKVWRM